MRILSIRKGFQADHSSTSYEFYAIDKALNRSERADVASLSSRARPTRRRVSFIYHGEWSDLPGGWQPLVKKYYDVMYSESYDSWTLAMAFDTDRKTIERIKKYEFRGTDEMGIAVNTEGNRVIVSIFCRLRPGIDLSDDYSYCDYDEEEEESEDAIESDDSLLNVLAQNREYLKNGDYRLLYGGWEKYGSKSGGGEEAKGKTPPKLSGMNDLPRPIQYLLSLLEPR